MSRKSIETRKHNILRKKNAKSQLAKKLSIHTPEIVFVKGFTTSLVRAKGMLWRSVGAMPDRMGRSSRWAAVSVPMMSLMAELRTTSIFSVFGQ